jgi:hypothetical protein
MSMYAQGGEDSIGSPTPVPPKPRDPERTKRLLLQVIAVAAVATAVFSGVTAWETRQERIVTKEFYCANSVLDYETGELAKDYDDLEKAQQLVVDALGCELVG